MNPLDAPSSITGAAPIGMFVVLVAETGWLVGISLPNDSVLFTGLPPASTGTARSMDLADSFGPNGDAAGGHHAPKAAVARFIPIIGTVMNPTARGVGHSGARVHRLPGVERPGVDDRDDPGRLWPGTRIPGIDTCLLPIIVGSPIPVTLEVLPGAPYLAGQRTRWVRPLNHEPGGEWVGLSSPVIR